MTYPNPQRPLLACLLVLALIPIISEPLLAQSPRNPADGFLKANGTMLCDNNGRGKPIQLRGVNLGGWLKWESWMCPADSSKTLRDGNPGHNGYDFELRKLLTGRFGAAEADRLIQSYQDAWITVVDLDNIKNLGMNVVRLPISCDNLLTAEGQWRPDGFKRMDWLVDNAWRRGLYTIIDLHAWLPAAADQDGSAKGFWANDALKAQVVELWKRIAAHYKCNPAIAMYDLLNEPINSAPKGLPAPSSATVGELHDQLYKAIRSVDPDHAIAMEGMWGWKTLRDPAAAGYQNVVYSFHWYNWGGKSTADRNKATDGDLNGLCQMYEAWHIPSFIGEFNLFGDAQAWRYALEQYNQRQLSWTMWSYKHTASGSCSWGVYTTLAGKAPAVPNLATDSADEIRSKWKAWATSPEIFALNPMFKPLLQPSAPQQ